MSDYYQTQVVPVYLCLPRARLIFVKIRETASTRELYHFGSLVRYSFSMVEPQQIGNKVPELVRIRIVRIIEMRTNR